MKKALQSKIFWIMFVIISLLIFFVLMNNNRNFKSESDILIIAKSELAAADLNQTVSNIAYIPHTLSFYDRMVMDNDIIVDDLKDLPSLEKKFLWERKIETQKVKESGIIKIIIKDQDQIQAEVISKQAGITLASYLSRIYDINADIDLRIIDGPITSYDSSFNFFVALLLSLLGGFSVSGIVYWIFFQLSKIKLQSNAISLPVSLVEILKNKNKTSKGLVYEEEKSILAKEPIASTAAKAVAPANLPIVDDEMLSNLASPLVSNKETVISRETLEEATILQEPTQKEVANKVAKLSRKDPTPEEVKERLNKLLSGEL